MNDVEFLSVLSPYYHNQSFILYVEICFEYQFFFFGQSKDFSSSFCGNYFFAAAAVCDKK